MNQAIPEHSASIMGVAAMIFAARYKVERRLEPAFYGECSLRLLTNTFYRDNQVHRLRSRAEIHLDIEIFQF